MKKLFSLMLSMILIVSICVPSVAANKAPSFNAWSENNKYAGEEETATLASKLNRENLAYIISEAFDIEPHPGIKIKDVPSDYWAYDAICSMVAKGIMELDDGRFFPAEYITREQIPQYFKFLNISYPEIGQLNFEDIGTVTPEYQDLFKRFVTAGYLQPVSEKYLLPSRIITITETISMLDRMFPNVENKVMKEATYDGHFLLRGANTYLSNINISGDLIITEGIIDRNKNYVDNTVSLENIKVDGNIYILGGSLLGKFSFKNVQANNIVVVGDKPIIISLANCSFEKMVLDSALANIVTDKSLTIERTK